MVNIGTEAILCILYNRIASSHTDSASPTLQLLRAERKNKLPAFQKMINKSPLHHGFKQQKHNNNNNSNNDNNNNNNDNKSHCFISSAGAQFL